MHRADYIEHLTAHGLGAKTIRLYVRAVERAHQALGPLEDVTATGLASYADGLAAGYSTRRHLRTALRAYWSMLGVDGPLQAIRVPPKPRSRCLALDEDDARAMIKTAVGWYPEGLAVLLAMYLALRSSEIAAAHMDRFADNLTWYTVTGKRDITATLPVHPTLISEIRAAGVTGWVFPGYYGREHVTPQTIWNWIRLAAEEAGVDDRIWPHRLRHTALATANDNTGDLRAVADFARHRDVSVTMIYTRTTERNLRRVSAALEY